MRIERTIGIIGGNGWLGRAIATAALASGTLAPDRLILSTRTELAKVEPIPGAAWTNSNAELAARAEVILLSVRPEQFAEVRIDASGRLVVSVMAGISAEAIAAKTGASEVVRAIPNAAAAIRRAFTPWYAPGSVSAENRALVQRLFAACGEAAEVSSEAQIDYCAAMTGTGAAYPALLAEALIAHAVAHGLPQAFAARAARSLLTDASQLFAGESGDAATIVGEMIAYRGMTAAALQTMRDNGFDAVVGAGLDAALAKGAASG